MKRRPGYTGSAFVGCGPRAGGQTALTIPQETAQAQNPPVLLSLRLDVEPPLQVLQTYGRRCHRTPASHIGGDAAQQYGPFAPLALARFVATTDTSVILSPSAHFPGSLVIDWTWLRRLRRRAR